MVTEKYYELNYEITKLISNEYQFTKIIFSKHTFSIYEYYNNFSISQHKTLLITIYIYIYTL